MDGSMIYGSSVEQSAELREFSKGLKKTKDVGGKAFLPADPKSTCSANPPPGAYCTKSGKFTAISLQ